MFASLGAAGGGGDPRTALGVAGSLRRMRLRLHEYGDRGLIVIHPRELLRWAKMQARCVGGC